MCSRQNADAMPELYSARKPARARNGSLLLLTMDPIPASRFFPLMAAPCLDARKRANWSQETYRITWREKETHSHPEHPAPSPAGGDRGRSRSPPDDAEHGVRLPVQAAKIDQPAKPARLELRAHSTRQGPEHSRARLSSAATPADPFLRWSSLWNSN